MAKKKVFRSVLEPLPISSTPHGIEALNSDKTIAPEPLSKKDQREYQHLVDAFELFAQQIGTEEADRRKVYLRFGTTDIDDLVLEWRREEARKSFADALKVATASGKHRIGANALHNKPDGSREKHQLILKAWMTGKYKTRMQCAEVESDNLKISYDAARKALINASPPDIRGSARLSPDDWLRGQLANGACASTSLFAAAKEQGYTRDVIKEAKKRLGINSLKRGKAWYFQLREEI
jgi:hypothetical protein